MFSGYHSNILEALPSRLKGILWFWNVALLLGRLLDLPGLDIW